MTSRTQPEPGALNGAQSVVRGLIDAGIDTVFMNPGTSELQLVGALDARPDLHLVLCLAEGVATGSADGFARASGRPAAVVVHLGAGLSNSLSNLHNARRAQSPVVVLVGDHPTDHLRFDTPLQMDIESVAGAAAKQVLRARPGDDCRTLVRHAAEIATARPQGPVVVILQADALWMPGKPRSEPPEPAAPQPAAPEPAAPRADPVCAENWIRSAAAALAQPGRTALLVGGDILKERNGIEAADRIAQATGAVLLCQTFNAVHLRGAGVPAIERIPYLPDLAATRLKEFDRLVLAGSRPPVAFFASEGTRSELTREGVEIVPFDDRLPALDALKGLAAMVASSVKPRHAAGHRAAPQTGQLKPRIIWAILNRCLPEGAVVSDESGTVSIGSDEAMRGAQAHRWMNLTGGALGQGLPAAVGAAIGMPGAKVVALQGDGGAMYAMQALWSQARERLPITNIVFRNDRYAILEHEIRRRELPTMSAAGASMFTLDNPCLDWVRIAQGMGLHACSVDTAAEFETQLIQCLAMDRPSLIEVIVSRPGLMTASLAHTIGIRQQ